MSGPEKIQIEFQKDVDEKIEKTNALELKSSTDFDDTYRKWLLANGVDIFADETKIIKATDGKYLIAKEDGGLLRTYVIIKNKELLKDFVYYITDTYNRELLTKMGAELHDIPDVDIQATVESKEEIVVGFQKELNELKWEIVSLDDIKERLATLLGWTYTKNGTEVKTDGQYDEIMTLLKKQKNLNTIQKANVKIFEELLKTAKTDHLDVIKKDIKIIKGNDFTKPVV